MKFYKCPICGKIIAIVDAKPGVPTICCGRPMEELEPNTQDGAHEKHIPVYEVKDNVLTVKVGSVEHPMMDAHFIQWIAVQTTMGNKRAVLKPGEKPEARFALLPGEEVIAVLEYCNLHGLYQG
ncbi:MAG: desulfoferrodoxin [Bacilli bacterium]|nr:desulfoferrodoxin [Bacilli bacterium]